VGFEEQCDAVSPPFYEEWESLKSCLAGAGKLPDFDGLRGFCLWVVVQGVHAPFFEEPCGVFVESLGL